MRAVTGLRNYDIPLPRLAFIVNVSSPAEVASKRWSRMRMRSTGGS